MTICNRLSSNRNVIPADLSFLLEGSQDLGITADERIITTDYTVLASEVVVE